MKSILLGAAIGAAALIVSISSAQAESVTITTNDGSRHGDGDRIDHRDDGEWDHHWRHHRSVCVIKTTRTWHHGAIVVKRTQVCHPAMAGDYPGRPPRY